MEMFTTEIMKTFVVSSGFVVGFRNYYHGKSRAVRKCRLLGPLSARL